MPASRFRICLSAAALAGAVSLAGCAGGGTPVAGGEVDAKPGGGEAGAPAASGAGSGRADAGDGKPGGPAFGIGENRSGGPRWSRPDVGRATTSARTPLGPLADAELPGLGPQTRANVPEEADQVVIVTGESKGSSQSHVVLYERTQDGWKPGASWPAHNAAKGWSKHHHIGDLSSPIGVFTLTDAGGLLPDPGTALPYHRSDGFTVDGSGIEGEPLAGSFDYVIAIDYNRKKGTSPLDWTRPEGESRGGGIWLHVDHGGPTQACISLSKAHMKELLRTLRPDRRPVVVMGDERSLVR